MQGTNFTAAWEKCLEQRSDPVMLLIQLSGKLLTLNYARLRYPDKEWLVKGALLWDETIIIHCCVLLYPQTHTYYCGNSARHPRINANKCNPTETSD